jgi:hypothetical protein
MDDEQVRRVLQGLVRLCLNLHSELLELKASVIALKVTAASLTGDDPKQAMDQFRAAEQRIAAADPSSQQVQELTELLNVLEKHGRTFGKNQA